jgi:lipopolysaccharide/colanic/teichoic acid biosynthesis glycosyltransferase
METHSKPQAYGFVASLPDVGRATPALPFPPGVAVGPAVPWGTRLLEIAVSSLALAISAPIMLLIAVIIRRGTPGPPLFWQKRIAQNLGTFRFVKFRTLYADARERFPHLYAYQYTPSQIQQFHFKVENDPRVTPQGHWLRRSTLDELPNFWNVLKGDMALVGPRPEIPELLPYYQGSMFLKFTVRPGITGLAQVSGRGRLSFQETVRMDVEYVRTRSWRLDLRLLLKTVRMVVFRDGAF